MHYKQLTRTGFFGRIGAAVVLSLTLGACSSVPDWANPVEWYKGTAEWISGDDEETVAARKAARAPENAPPNADQPFPNLASVPARPQGIESRAQRRQQVESGLVADRSRARHAALSPGDSPQNVRGAPPPPKLSAPPQAAAPATPSTAPATGNQAFQKAIAQQSAAAGRTRQSPGPVRRNTMAVPPPSLGTVKLIPPGSSASGGGQLARAAPPPPMPGPIGRTGRSISVGTILFANGSAEISGKYAKTLRAIVKMQKERGGTIRVIGHASSRTRDTNPLGHQLANFRISLARAKAVAAHLVRYGAPRGSITVTGVADNQPIYHEFMPLGEAGNRRAEIYLDY